MKDAKDTKPIQANILLKEAAQQKHALEQLACWMRNAMILSSCAVALAWWGLTGTGIRFGLGIFGIVLAIAGAGCAALIGLGIRNGRRNVAHILQAAEQKADPKKWKENPA